MNWLALKKWLHRCDTKGCWRYAILRSNNKIICSNCYAKVLERRYKPK